MGKGKEAGDVRRTTDLERRAVRKSEGDRRQRLARKEWGKRWKVRQLDEETSAAGVSDKWGGWEESRHSSQKGGRRCSDMDGKRWLRRHERQGESDRKTSKVVRDTKCGDSGRGNTQGRKGVSRHR